MSAGMHVGGHYSGKPDFRFVDAIRFLDYRFRRNDAAQGV